MNSDRFERLIWERLDGTIEPADRDELETYLAAHPEARDEERELSALCALLDSVEEIDPPPTLRRAIDRQLAASADPAPREQSWLASVRQFFSVPERLPYAYLAAGFLLGVTGYHILSLALQSSRPMDPSRLYGTMNRQGAISEQQPVPTRLPELQADLSLYRDGSTLVVKLSKTSAAAAQITLASPGSGLWLVALEHVGGSVTRLQTQVDGVGVEAAGPGEVLVAVGLHRPRHPVHLQISSEGALLVDRSVVLGDLAEDTTNF